MAEHGCLHKEILLKKEKEILDYLSTKGKRDSMAKVLGWGLVRFYQSRPCMLEGRLLLRGGLLSGPPHTATHCFQQRHMWFTGKEKKAAARRKCQFLGILFILKMKAGTFHCTFLVCEEGGQKYMIFIFVLIQQSFSKPLPKMDWFSYLLFLCFQLRVSASL